MKDVLVSVQSYVAFITVCSVTSKHYLPHPCFRHPSSTRVVQKEMRALICMGKSVFRSG
jgi:hypothetical protein